MPTVSAIVIVKNEERHLRGCLEGLTWADQVVVLDSFSQDATVAIAREFTPHVYQRAFTTLPNQRNAALSYAGGEWIWVMDADERLSPELRDEILDTVHDPGDRAGFWVPRYNIILGKVMHHAGWYPDRQLRLFRRQQVIYDERYMGHERMLVRDGAGGYRAVAREDTGHLKNHYLHYNYETIGQLARKQNFYADLEARALAGFGLRARPQNFVLQPLREIHRRYVAWEGWKDGGHGLLMSLVMAVYQVAVYGKLARLNGMEWTVGRRPVASRQSPVGSGEGRGGG